MIFKDSTWKWQKDFRVENLMGFQVSLMKIDGQWPINFKNYLPNFLSFLSRPVALLYFSFWSFVALHIAIFFAIKLVIKMRSDDATIPEITSLFIQSVIYGFAFYATIHFQWYHKHLAKIVNFMIENFKMRSARGLLLFVFIGDVSNVRCVESISLKTIRTRLKFLSPQNRIGLTYVTTEPCYTIAKSFSLYYTLLCIAGVLHFILLPIYLQVWELPLSCWYPFDYRSSVIFVLVYISQCFGQIQVALAFANSDIIIVCLVLLIVGQYDILFCSLKNVRYTAIMLNGLEKNRAELKAFQNQILMDDEERNQYYYSYEQREDLDDDESASLAFKEMEARLKGTCFKDNRATDTFLTEYQNELSVALRECIIHHQNLVKVCGMLEWFYNPIVLVKSLQVTLQICNLAYVSTTTTSSFLQNINYLEYLFLTLFDIMIFGYAGNWIKEQSIRVGDAALRCSWHLCGGRFRRDLSIILANNVLPIKLTGGKFFILDYTKIIAIVQASFSFYTLLKNLS